MAVRAFNAAIDGVGCVRELVIGETADDITIACSSSDGAFLELEGTEDWEGEYSAYGGYSPNGYPNDALSLAFNINQAVDKGGSGTAIIEAVRVNWDFVTNYPITNTVKFAGDGAFTWGAQTTSDATTPSPLPSRDGKIEIATPATSPSFSTLGHVLGASLVVFSDTFRFADSSTTGGYEREPGILGWRVELEVHADDPSAQEALNGDKHVRMYIDSTHYWDIKWVKWKKIGDLRVSIQGHEYVTSRYRGMGTGYVTISDVWTKGALIDPADTPKTIWS